MRDVVVLGVGMHKFGKFPDKGFEDLAEVAARAALQDAGVEWQQIQAMYAASAFSGPQCGNRVMLRLGESGIPLANVEAFCASGMVATWLALQSIAGGFMDLALVVGFEKQERGFIPMRGFPDWQLKLGMAALPCRSAMEINRHMQLYGLKPEHLAKISVKNHRNAAFNPYAHYPMPDLTVEQVLGDEMVCDPLTRMMMGPPSDGAAAAVLCSADWAKKIAKKKPVRIAAVGVVTTSYTDLGGEARQGRARAAKQVYEQSGCGPEDLDFALLHDATSAHELFCYEDVGLCKEGEGGRLIDEGRVELTGDIPVNMDGGFTARGNATGADGLAFIAEAVWQLRGEAGSRQVQGNPKTCLIVNPGLGKPLTGAAAILQI